MSPKLSTEERQLLQAIDGVVRRKSVMAAIDPIVEQAEEKLTQAPGALMAWETIPLALYGGELPSIIRSSWVFVLRAQAVTGAERHPNSHQRVMSYRGAGDLQVWGDERWHSHSLVSDFEAALEGRWASVPPNVWHQVVVPEKNWVVVSFHTAPEDELIEERPDPADMQSTRQRKYLAEL